MSTVVNVAECIECPSFEIRVQPGFAPLIGKCHQSDYVGDIIDMKEYCPFESHDNVFCDDCSYFHQLYQDYDVGTCKKNRIIGSVETLKVHCPLTEKTEEKVYKADGSFKHVTGYLQQSSPKFNEITCRYCEKCGAKNEITDKYCHECGYKMRSLNNNDDDDERFEMQMQMQTGFNKIDYMLLLAMFLAFVVGPCLVGGLR